jgi:hypothetical protein
MSEILRVEWTIFASKLPEPVVHCQRCGCTKRFRSSGRFRVNANGKRLDAWLIYRCTSCDATWNRPILERRGIQSIDAQLLAMLHASDPELARRTAFDTESLGRCTERIEEFDDFSVRKNVLSDCARPGQVEIVCHVPVSIRLRLDRLLAGELRVSRSGFYAWQRRPESARVKRLAFLMLLLSPLVAFAQAARVEAVRVWEAPDNASMAAAVIAIGAGGALASMETTALITVEETLSALQKASSVNYVPPGRGAQGGYS